MNALKIVFLSLILVVNIVQSESSKTENLNFYINEQELIDNSLNEMTYATPSKEDEIIEKLEEELVHFVIFAFCDITGTLKEIVLPIEQAKDALKYGVSLNEQAILLKPDAESMRFLPWTNSIHRTAWIMCTIHKTLLEPSPEDPRAILTALNNTIIDLGYDFKVGISLDFFLLEKNEQGLFVPIDQAKYLDPEYNLSKQQEINLLIHALRDFNVEIEKIDHGKSNGQWRLTLKNADALKMADAIIACKYALRVLTTQLKQHISFMPKPFSDKNCNKMHINYTLFERTTDKNAFFDQLDPLKLSLIAKYFLAGNLESAMDLSALVTPTVNSYKTTLRTSNNWSSTDYSALFNSILSPQDEQQEKLSISFTMADSSCNIYLTLAALLKSGISGLKKLKNSKEFLNKQTCASSSIELPITTYKWPVDLNEALTIFEKSSFMKELLSNDGHLKYLELKKLEWAEYNNHITDWEIQKYLCN